MATFKVGDSVSVRFSGGKERGTVLALSFNDDSVQVQWPDCRVWHGVSILEHAPEATPAWTRPDYAGSGSCTVPEGVDPESLAPDGAVAEFRGEELPILAWVTPNVWVRFGASGRMLEWNPHYSGSQIRMPGRKGESVDGWTRLIDWPGLDAWRAQQAQAAPKPVDMGPGRRSAAQRRELLLGGGVTVTELDDDALPPQDQRSHVHAWHLDGDRDSKATAGPDIVPAAVLARRATGYRRVSVPTDLTDGLIPDAEPDGIVPRGAR